MPRGSGRDIGETGGIVDIGAARAVTGATACGSPTGASSDPVVHSSARGDDTLIARWTVSTGAVLRRVAIRPLVQRVEVVPKPGQRGRVERPRGDRDAEVPRLADVADVGRAIAPELAVRAPGGIRAIASASSRRSASSASSGSRRREPPAEGDPMVDPGHAREQAERPTARRHRVATMTDRKPSAVACRQAWSGPAPPNAIRSKSAGSCPRRMVMRRFAWIIAESATSRIAIAASERRHAERVRESADGGRGGLPVEAAAGRPRSSTAPIRPRYTFASVTVGSVPPRP